MVEKFDNEISARKYVKDVLKLQNPAPNLKFLTELIEAATLATVWTNIEVVRNNRTSLVPKDAFTEAYVNAKGGTCRDLNLGFYYIATELGFTVKLCSAMAEATDHWPMEGVTQESHIVNIVEIDGTEYVVDLGWGRNPRKPLRLHNCDLAGINDAVSNYRVILGNDQRFELQIQIDNKWITQYNFSTTEKQIKDFKQHLDYVYTKFPFNNKLFCFSRLPKSRIVYAGGDHLTQFFSDGSEETTSLTELGGVKPMLIKHFNLPSKYIEALKLGDFKDEVQGSLTDLWEISNVEPESHSTISQLKN